MSPPHRRVAALSFGARCFFATCANPLHAKPYESGERDLWRCRNRPFRCTARRVWTRHTTAAAACNLLRINEVFSSPLSTGTSHNILWLEIRKDLRLDESEWPEHIAFHVAAATGPELTRPVLFRVGREKMRMAISLERAVRQTVSRVFTIWWRNSAGTGGNILLTLYLVLAATIQHNIQFVHPR